MFLRDQYDELSLREQDAARALKSALIGFLLCPLQLYTTFLILMVIIAEEPLRRRYFWYTIVASTVLAFHVTLMSIMWFIGYLL